ncbi:Cell division cycle protein 23 -like protein [Trichinella pseudospiralis]|uniref:Cell division cycle protein 23-like protein n=1 Tax=Trichinella pseudospiralis TaxID=6337 RepID=A0A0V0Y9C7_TRIPS|nr:Cell division cycle protein 23 -like protein [Trichinella pseudospiralis]KRY90103.1 Cell division cycle protein 23 -like protein [Trichinella pseudospiralis]
MASDVLIKGDEVKVFQLPPDETFIHDMWLTYCDCQERRLLEYSYFLIETAVLWNSELKDIKLPPTEYSSLPVQDRISIRFAQSCLDKKAFLRVISFFDQTAVNKDISKQTPVIRFFYYYSQYLHLERNRLGMGVGGSKYDRHRKKNFAKYSELKTALAKLADETDPYLVYLLGMIYKRLYSYSQAQTCFVKAVLLLPRCFPAWYELARLPIQEYDFPSMPLPNHWMKVLMTVEYYLYRNQPARAMEQFDRLPTALKRSTLIGNYFSAQMLSKLGQLNTAHASYEIIMRLDKQCMWWRPAYANYLMSVEKSKESLAAIAYDSHVTNAFSFETELVYGIYASLFYEDIQHSKAVLHYRHALAMNSDSAEAWTMLGHSLQLIENSIGAMFAYERAVERDPFDVRALYYLGLFYQEQKKDIYALYYLLNALSMATGNGKIASRVLKIIERLKNGNRHCHSRLSEQGLTKDWLLSMWNLLKFMEQNN